MSFLEFLIIHCTATRAGVNVTADDVIRWHTAPTDEGGRGWRRVGYSDIIYLNGELVNLTPFNQDNTVDPWEVTNGARGINGKSRHLCYVGGLDVDPELIFPDEEDMPEFNDKYVPMDTRTSGQLDTMEVYVKYMIKRHPHIKIAGHNQFSSKACPSFQTPGWLESIGIPDVNIYRG